MDPVTGSAGLRKAIAAALAKRLGSSWAIFPAADAANKFTKPTLLLERTLLTRLKSAPQGFHESTYTLIVVSPRSIANTKEDYLDGLCDDVLEGLEANSIPWQTAERAVFSDTYPCYKITLTGLNQRKTS